MAPPSAAPITLFVPLLAPFDRRGASASRAPSDGGFTLIETLIVFAVMSVGLLAGMALLDRSRSQTEAATSLAMVEDRARGALAGIFDVLTETSIKHVDTAMRIHGPVAANDVFSDRFTIPGVALRQCTSASCTFHTRDDLSLRLQEHHCGHEYCAGLFGNPVTRGKNWPAVFTACPLDGSSLSTVPRLDGVKFFVARDSTGAFTQLPDGRPLWGGLVFLFPCASQSGSCELRRYDVYVSDLLAFPAVCSTGWNRFNPQNPSMIDLFDFGKNGTTNGIPDKKVPLTNAASDATSEVFTTGMFQGEPSILISKQLSGGSGGPYPQRSLSLRVNLETGETEFTVDHHDTATVFWTATSTFTRMPRTLIRRMTELAVSTAVSDPFDAVANPTGVDEPNVVRVTLATSDAPKNEATGWVHHVESFHIKARN
jgi:prepilin-type N-terminal cleavage/methylation domain-containing protein